MNGLLFSLPGTPVIYYGDEIGMGDNIYLGDRDGVRTPMQWSADRNAGFSRANPQQLYPAGDHRSRIPLRVGQRRGAAAQPQLAAVVDARAHRAAQAAPAFGRGSIEFLLPENAKVLAFIRHLEGDGAGGDGLEGETVLVVANLSRFAQTVTLDLHGPPGVGAGGAVRRQRVRAHHGGRLHLTLGAYGFYWFSLQPQHHDARGIAPNSTTCR